MNCGSIRQCLAAKHGMLLGRPMLNQKIFKSYCGKYFILFKKAKKNFLRHLMDLNSRLVMLQCNFHLKYFIYDGIF